jgi:hypothetical protein
MSGQLALLAEDLVGVGRGVGDDLLGVGTAVDVEQGVEDVEAVAHRAGHDDRSDVEGLVVDGV